MKDVSTASIVAYCVFSLFVFYQQLHVKNFRGASQVFESILSLSALAGMATGLIYFALCWKKFGFWVAVLIFVIGLVATPVGFVVERLAGPLLLSLLGFVGWPLSAWLMFKWM